MVDVSHVVQAMNGMREAFTRMEGALNRVCEQLAESMPKPHPVGEKVEPFSHTDPDGDTLEVAPVYPEPTPCAVLYAHKVGGGTVIFDQTAVNELAQYLDRYRTDDVEDVADDIDAVRTGQPPSHLIGALCAGHFPDRAADKTGCDCFREVHGALGCTVPGCPCERRGGR
jgi:hypothetical protein